MWNGKVKVPYICRIYGWVRQFINTESINWLSQPDVRAEYEWRVKKVEDKEGENKENVKLDVSQRTKQTREVGSASAVIR